MIKRMLLITIGFSVIVWAGFSRNNTTKIVTDNSTGLQWEDDIIVNKTWIQAINYCESLTLGSYTNWRLPNFNELYHLADKSKDSLVINSVFQNVVPNEYWSSTTVVGYKNKVWNVSFYNGEGSWYSKSYGGYVRCVRVEQ